MLNYTTLLRSKLSLPDSDWVTCEHPSFGSACKAISKQNTKPNINQRKIERKITPIKRQPKIDLVSTYNNIIELSNKKQTRKNPRKMQKASFFKNLDRLDTIEERLISQQDKQVDTQQSMLLTQQYDSCKTSKQRLKQSPKQRQSTAVSITKLSKTLNLNSIGIIPYTTNLSKVKLSTLGNRKIQLDVSKVIKKSLPKQPKEITFRERYFSK